MNTTKRKRNYRIKYLDGCNNVRFITRDNGKVAHFSGSMTPLALSNVAGDNAAMLSFALNDARDANDAAIAIRKLGQYAGNLEIL